MPQRAPHLYQLDMPNHRAGGEPRCQTCHGRHDDPVHVRHTRECKNIFGHGTSTCPACVLEAEAVAAKGGDICKTNPYSKTCGFEGPGAPACEPCPCGRKPYND